MILVTGAKGQLGRGVVARLLSQLPASDIAASVRDPAKAADIAERGVEVRRGDFADPASLTAAFTGAEQVLLVSADKPARMRSACTTPLSPQRWKPA